MVRWRWETPKDERDFYDPLRQSAREGTRAHGGGVVVRRSGGGVSLVMAPDFATARRLVRGA